MTVEQLLVPRRKVMINYPDSPYEVGKILICNLGTSWYDKFPEIFKEVFWWEERKPEELPKYVRVVTNADKFELPHNCVREVNEWRKLHFQLRADCFPVVINAMCLLPATEQEYLTQQTSNNGK